MSDRFDGTEHPHAYSRLFELGNALEMRRFETSLGARAVLVVQRGDATGRVQSITCTPRPDDGGRLWFYSLGEPIAQADQVIDAAVIIAADLAPSDVTTGDDS
ncbi:hypothetical protein [Actinomadura rubrisoli]|uniref:Uncharacterized protein n=1 Tax=Actinomadura rubrisoli TaxID=2530368 RepID=A0A4R5A3C9_9ACTN|nr:hypothetical protein [Actinomadura rubrisoli]TDD65109.1 hypothetical protein E1298_41710 [Actinomadura rubrisoli]